MNLCGKTNYIHRLVAQTFIPNPDNLTDVDHIDGDKDNNNVENLRWCTHKQNINYAIEKGLFDPSRIMKEYSASEEGRRLHERQQRTRSQPVVRDDGVEYPSVRAAADAAGRSYSSVLDVLMGRAKKCNGHSYRYADGIKSKSMDRRRRAVLQIDPTTLEVVARYPSRAEAVMAMDNTGIGNCLRGAAKTSAGYIWKYEDEVA